MLGEKKDLSLSPGGEGYTHRSAFSFRLGVFSHLAPTLAHVSKYLIQMTIHPIIESE